MSRVIPILVDGLAAGICRRLAPACGRARTGFNFAVCPKDLVRHVSLGIRCRRRDGSGRTCRCRVHNRVEPPVEERLEDDVTADHRVRVAVAIAAWCASRQSLSCTVILVRSSNRRSRLVIERCEGIRGIPATVVLIDVVPVEIIGRQRRRVFAVRGGRDAKDAGNGADRKPADGVRIGGRVRLPASHLVGEGAARPDIDDVLLPLAPAVRQDVGLDVAEARRLEARGAPGDLLRREIALVGGQRQPVVVVRHECSLLVLEGAVELQEVLQALHRPRLECGRVRRQIRTALVVREQRPPRRL